MDKKPTIVVSVEIREGYSTMGKSEMELPIYVWGAQGPSFSLDHIEALKASIAVLVKDAVEKTRMKFNAGAEASAAKT